MEISAAANWLNQTFASFDQALLGAFHGWAQAWGSWLTPLFEGISLLGAHGLGMIILGLILLLFKKTRKTGAVVLVAIALSYLVSNMFIKKLVQRPRPFEDAQGLYNAWWTFVGAPAEHGFSFPSGHVAITAAAMVGIFLCWKHPLRYLALVFALVMGVSRNYLMVHYPSDVLAGLIVGALAALAAWWIVGKLAARLGKLCGCTAPKTE